MSKIKHQLSWRTSPRSIPVLLGRMKYFYNNLYNRKYSPKELYRYRKLNPYYPSESKPKYIHPYRRQIVYDIVSNEGMNPNDTNISLKNKSNKFVSLESKKDFVEGHQPAGDNADKESRLRQVTATAQQFGLISSKTLKLTPLGFKAVKGTFTPEDLDRQLLKMYVVTNRGEGGVFPFKVFLQLIHHFKYLSLYEMMFIFWVLRNNKKDMDNVMNAIDTFRQNYLNRNIIQNRNDKKKIIKLIFNVWVAYFDKSLSKENKNQVDKLFGKLHDYADALKNTLIWTGVFETHGYGDAKHIRVRNWTAYEYQDLYKYDFKNSLKYLVPGTSSKNNLAWYGKPDNVTLPWLNPKSIRNNMLYKLRYLNKRVESNNLKKYRVIYSGERLPISKLEHLDDGLNNLAKKANLFKFIHDAPTNESIHKNILTVYDEISKNEFKDGKPSLYLENNTWKALYSIGSRIKDLNVYYHGKTDPDLKPKSYARGGTSDMAATFDNTRFVVEVSLMSSVEQWEHEASSVITHIDDDIKAKKAKNIYGIFLVNSINFRTWWQYFILNKSSWLNQPIPVAPLRIKDFMEILKTIYLNDLDIYNLDDLVLGITNNAKHASNYEQWQKNIPKIIDTWRSHYGILNHKFAAL